MDTHFPIISSYSRTEALEDGVLIDASTLAREAGITYPLARIRPAYDGRIQMARHVR